MLYVRWKSSLKIAIKAFRKYMYREPDMNDPDDLRLLGIYRKTRHFCSGPCCGNPRKHFGEKTIQERRQEAN